MRRAEQHQDAYVRAIGREAKDMQTVLDSMRTRERKGRSVHTDCTEGAFTEARVLMELVHLIKVPPVSKINWTGGSLQP